MYEKQKANNPSRTENAGQARALDDQVTRASERASKRAGAQLRYLRAKAFGLSGRILVAQIIMQMCYESVGCVSAIVRSDTPH